MKIIGDNTAAIETLSEFDLFEGIYTYIPTETRMFFNFLRNHKFIVTKQAIKEKLLLPQDVKGILAFNQYQAEAHFNNLPDLVLNNNHESNNNGRYYFLPNNIITINKNIRELYDLGKLCGLWE